MTITTETYPAVSEAQNLSRAKRMKITISFNIETNITEEGFTLTLKGEPLVSIVGNRDENRSPGMVYWEAVQVRMKPVKNASIEGMSCPTNERKYNVAHTRSNTLTLSPPSIGRFGDSPTANATLGPSFTMSNSTTVSTEERHFLERAQRDSETAIWGIKLINLFNKGKLSAYDPKKEKQLLSKRATFALPPQKWEIVDVPEGSKTSIQSTNVAKFQRKEKEESLVEVSVKVTSVFMGIWQEFGEGHRDFEADYCYRERTTHEVKSRVKVGLERSEVEPAVSRTHKYEGKTLTYHRLGLI